MAGDAKVWHIGINGFGMNIVGLLICWQWIILKAKNSKGIGNRLWALS
jgi:hypothetical protein